MGMVALGFAVWNVRTLVPGWLYQALWTAVLLAGAGVLGAFRPSGGVASSLGRGLGLLMLVLGLLLGVKSLESGTKVSLLPRFAPGREAETRRSPWMEQDYEGALAKAKAGGKLLVVDVYADWCAACKELDEKTWPDPDVSAWLARNAVAVRIDTHKVRRDLAASLQIRGYPTVLVVDARGKVLRRREGFQEPLRMLQFLLGT
jgi:thiol:disulfide interchange protein DsbD